jgi:hypothetical protein
MLVNNVILGLIIVIKVIGSILPYCTIWILNYVTTNSIQIHIYKINNQKSIKLVYYWQRSKIVYSSFNIIIESNTIKR